MKRQILGLALLGAAVTFVAPIESKAVTIRYKAKVKCCKSVKSVVEDTGKAIGNAPGNIIREGGNASHDVVKAVGEGAEDIGQGIGKTGENIVREGERFVNNSGREIGRAGRNIEELGSGLKNYVESYYDDTRRHLSDAEARLRHGKIADAFWHSAYDPYKDSDGRAARLAQESSLARTTGAVAATAYGGSGGSAAFSAWYTYRATNGDINAAIKAGLISGATSEGMEYVRGVGFKPGPAGVRVDMATSEMVKRSIMAGAIGGVAVAASGGDNQDVIEAFIRSGGMMLIQDGYRQLGHDLIDSGKIPTEESVCSLTVPAVVGPNPPCAPPREWFKINDDGSIAKVNGKPVLDMAKVPSNYNWIGKSYAFDATDPGVATEGSWLMRNFAAKVPGMNGMAIMHDEWVIANYVGDVTNVATIVPAIVVYYAGTEAGIQDQIRQSVVTGAVRTTALSSVDIAASSAKIDDSSRHESYLCMKGGGVPVVENQPFPISVPKLAGLEVQTHHARIDQYVAAPKMQTGPIVSRSIFVAKGNDEGQLACAVIYQKDSESDVDSAPWYAIHDSNYCSLRARELAQKHQKEGWYCLAR